MDTIKNEINNLSISNFLSEKINDYLAGTNKTLNNLSNTTGISRPSLIKIQKAELNLKRIDPLKIVKLLRVIDKQNFNKYPEIYKKKLQEVSPTYGLAFEGVSFDFIKEDHETEKIFHELQDSNALICFILASNNGGTTLKQLYDVIGKSSVATTESLISKGYLKFSENDKITASNPGHIIFDIKHEKRILHELLQRCNMNHLGDERIFMSHITNTISKEGLSELLVENARFSRNIRRIFDNNPGDIPAFSGVFMDTFTEKNKQSIKLKKEKIQ